MNVISAPTPPSVCRQHRSARFTLDGSSELEAGLERRCAQIREGVLEILPASKLEGLVLGGGYGRGQGGVLKTEAGDSPYNDLEFYVFVRGSRLLSQARCRSKFDELSQALSSPVLHVEFKIDSLRELRRRSVSLFSYDLVSAHRILYGPKDLFDGCERHRDASRICATEPARLLLNRCSGLLLAQERLRRGRLSEEDGDFVGRNLAKASLALGDALLASLGQYHWDCLERARRLVQVVPALAGLPVQAILDHHSAGTRFKLHPIRRVEPLDQFRAEHRALTRVALAEWVWIENRRLSSNFSTVSDYAFSRIGKCREGGSWRNLLLNLRSVGAGATLDRSGWRYPRERLLNALPLLLGNEASIDEAATRRYLQRQLRTGARTWEGLVAAYKRLWSCYG